MRTEVIRMRPLFLTIVAATLVLPAAAAQGHQQQQHQGPAEDAASGYAGGTVLVPLHLHLYNLIDKVYMNTQPMDRESPDINRGPNQPYIEIAGQAPTSDAPYRLYGLNSPGPVHYNVSLGQPRIHPERGLADEVQLDTGQNIQLFLYLSADPSGTGEGGPVPSLTIRATLRIGDDPNTDLDAGQAVAQNSITLENWQTAPGEVSEVMLDLGAPQMAVIPRDVSYNLKVEWFVHEDGTSSVKTPVYRVHSGIQYDNRLILPVKNPIRMNYLHPQFIGDRKIAFHTAFNSPFGNYDVDLEQLQLEIKDASGNVIQPKSIQGPIIVQRTWEHNHHFEPVLVTWVWNYREDNADPADYTVGIRVTNLPGNALAEKSALFTILREGAGTAVSSSGEEIQPLGDQDNPTRDTPVLPLAVLAAAGLVAAQRLGRRERGRR